MLERCVRDKVTLRMHAWWDYMCFGGGVLLCDVSVLICECASDTNTITSCVVCVIKNVSHLYKPVSSCKTWKRFEIRGKALQISPFKIQRTCVFVLAQGKIISTGPGRAIVQIDHRSVRLYLTSTSLRHWAKLPVDHFILSIIAWQHNQPLTTSHFCTRWPEWRQCRQCT